MNNHFGDVDADGAPAGLQAIALQAEHEAILRDVLAAGGFWGGAGSSACEGYLTELNRNFQVIYRAVKSGDSRIQSAGSTMACTDFAVGSSWD
jgi:Proteins of 100 residues with WXG